MILFSIFSSSTVLYAPEPLVWYASAMVHLSSPLPSLWPLLARPWTTVFDWLWRCKSSKVYLSLVSESEPFRHDHKSLAAAVVHMDLSLFQNTTRKTRTCILRKGTSWFLWEVDIFVLSCELWNSSAPSLATEETRNRCFGSLCKGDLPATWYLRDDNFEAVALLDDRRGYRNNLVLFHYCSYLILKVSHRSHGQHQCEPSRIKNVGHWYACLCVAASQLVWRAQIQSPLSCLSFVDGPTSLSQFTVTSLDDWRASMHSDVVHHGFKFKGNFIAFRCCWSYCSFKFQGNWSFAKVIVVRVSIYITQSLTIKVN